MAHIQLFGTGGTIASRSSGHRGAVATDTAADVARSHYGELTVSTHDLLTTGSYRLGLGDLRTIAEHVRVALDDPATKEELLGRMPMGRFGPVGDVVGAVLYLASDWSDMVTGSSLMVDGGWTAA
ncbi:SDR family oxidoreductase [Kocuria sp. M1R5S2]|uniref:SDR family oxidoreductase n=1 Tax=Kocuria rhizosphaerae TaxID=3376285 RepID=UPI0037AD20CC